MKYTVSLCRCAVFAFWYAEDGTQICECGHPRAEHLDGTKSCIGEIHTKDINK